MNIMSMAAAISNINCYWHLTSKKRNFATTTGQFKEKIANGTDDEMNLLSINKFDQQTGFERRASLNENNNEIGSLFLFCLYYFDICLYA